MGPQNTDKKREKVVLLSQICDGRTNPIKQHQKCESIAKGTYVSFFNSFLFTFYLFSLSPSSSKANH
jgi:hypothetical protein